MEFHLYEISFSLNKKKGAFYKKAPYSL